MKQVSDLVGCLDGIFTGLEPVLNKSATGRLDDFVAGLRRFAASDLKQFNDLLVLLHQVGGSDVKELAKFLAKTEKDRRTSYPVVAGRLEALLAGRSDESADAVLKDAGAMTVAGLKKLLKAHFDFTPAKGAKKSDLQAAAEQLVHGRGQGAAGANSSAGPAAADPTAVADAERRFDRAIDAGGREDYDSYRKRFAFLDELPDPVLHGLADRIGLTTTGQSADTVRQRLRKHAEDEKSRRGRFG